MFTYVSCFLLFGALFFIESKLPISNPYIYKSIRYLVLALVTFVTFKKRKLSLWIFTSMILGIEVGIDFPEFAKDLGKLGTIFLRLIKTLVAPLIFSTLVIGIAGHSNLKQLGRMGLKSILYFEIVTTFALIIGLLAINISQAGKGVKVETTSAALEK